MVELISNDIKIVKVAVPCPLRRVFSYLSAEIVEVGVRVKVPFGARQVVGVVLGVEPYSEALQSEYQSVKLKSIHSVLDKKPVFDQTLLKLGEFLSTYYFHPVGEVFKAMLPGSSSKKNQEIWQLTTQGYEAKKNASHPYHSIIRSLFARKDHLNKSSIEKKWKKISQFDESTKHLSLEKLLKEGLIEANLMKSLIYRSSGKARQETNVSAHDSEPPPLLTSQQKKVLDEITTSIGLKKLKPFLLRGVTGSGKTEVYLHLIDRIFEKNKKERPQILVLVPEISLTPQMTSVFSCRFPGRVSVTHSGLSDKARWEVLEGVRSGEVEILISPRSGVFAPFVNLKLIIVDEEHDTSYKQSSNLRYHGRDIAVMRSNLDNALCLLGSATPSMESYYNALTNRYKLLQLRERVSGIKMPEISIVKDEAQKRGSLIDTRNPRLDTGSTAYLSKEVIKSIKENLALGQQTIVILNRRGYSYYLYNESTREVLQCHACNISLTLHKINLQLKCHYCQFSTNFNQIKLKYPQGKFFAIGLGSQKAEDQLKSAFPEAKISRLDSDIASKRDNLIDTLEEFRQKKIDILVGTQILAKGHDFPNVGLTVILNCDQMLSLPDFRAGERTFQLMVQAAGRAGRGSIAGKVLIQSLKDDDPVVATAMSHDFEGFAEQELQFRKSFGYPPFGKMILWEISGSNENNLHHYCLILEKVFEKLSIQSPEVFDNFKISGPTIPAIDKILNRFRRMVLFSSNQINLLHSVHHQLLSQIPKPSRGLRLTVDVDPQTLL